MGRRPDLTIYRDDPCPQRGVALTHVVNGTPNCVFCGARTRPGSSLVKIETGADGPVTFTVRELRMLEFLQHLYDKGRV